MLSQQQIEEYHEKGYLGVENVLSAAEVQELRDVTDEFIEKSRNFTDHADEFDLEPDHTPEFPRVRRLKMPHKIHPTYAKTPAARLDSEDGLSTGRHLCDALQRH